jgi:hypothetical protein
VYRGALTGELLPAAHEEIPRPVVAQATYRVPQGQRRTVRLRLLEPVRRPARVTAVTTAQAPDGRPKRTVTPLRIARR